MPAPGEELGVVVDPHPGAGGEPLRMGLIDGDEAPVQGVPVDPGVAGHGDLRLPGQRQPVEGLLHRNARFYRQLGAGDALGVVEPGIGVGQHHGVLGGPGDHAIKGPVAPRHRVPGLPEQPRQAHHQASAEPVGIAQGVGPERRAGDAAGQVRRHLHVGGPGRGVELVHQPDPGGVRQGQLKGASHHCLALLPAGVVAPGEAVGELVELGRGAIGLPQRLGAAAGRVVEAEVVGLVALDDDGDPGPGVEVPLAGGGVGGDPEPGGLLGGAVAPLHLEAEPLEQVGQVVPHPAALVLGTDQQAQSHRLLVEEPAPGPALGAELAHAGVDGLPGAVRVVGVAQLQGPGLFGEPRVVGKGGGERQGARHRQAAVELLGHVAPVDQPVEGLADLGQGEGVEAAVGQDRPRRIEGELAGRAEGQVHVGLHRIAQAIDHGGAGDALAEELMAARLDQPGDPAEVGLAQEDDLVEQRALALGQGRGVHRARHRSRPLPRLPLHALTIGRQRHQEYPRQHQRADAQTHSLHAPLLMRFPVFSCIACRHSEHPERHKFFQRLRARSSRLRGVSERAQKVPSSTA